MSIKLLLWLVIEAIVFILISMASKKVGSFQLYCDILERSKIPITNVISIKESLAYHVTKLFVDIPRLSFAPYEYEFRIHDNEKEYANTKCEMCIHYIIDLGLFLRSVFGNVIYDIIILMTIFYFKMDVSFSKAKHVIGDICDSFIKNFSIKNIITVFDWIQKNVNVLLVLIVVLLSLYIGWLKRKKKKYEIEAIWAEEDADRARKVAKLQKELENTLLQCRHDIYQNMIVIREKLGCVNGKDEIELNQTNDYSATTDKIKELLISISKVEGNQIYAKRNEKMYVQLTILELLPSLSDKKCFIVLDRLSKSYIENNCKNRKDLCREYAYGVALMNGINRFLKFSYKKRKQYNRIMMHITNTGYIKGVIENLKD